MTEWRDIEVWVSDTLCGIRTYKVSDQGDVRGPSGKLLKQSVNRHGYLRLGSHCVHRLVCMAFHGEPPTPHHEVRHLNGVKTDNRASNLAWGTHPENIADMIKHGTLPRGQKHWSAKLTWDDVHWIREQYATGNWTYPQLADECGVHPHTIAYIVRNRLWGGGNERREHV